jgi:tetratricopeptide (TPR) repeat protein
VSSNPTWRDRRHPGQRKPGSRQSTATISSSPGSNSATVTKIQGRIAGLVCVTFLVAGLFTNSTIHPVPLYGTESDLIGEYIPAARDLRRLVIEPTHFTTKGPGYPLILALATPLAGENAFDAAKCVNVLAATIALWGAFQLVAYSLGGYVGLIVLLGLVCNPTFLQATIEAGTDLPALAIALLSTRLAYTRSKWIVLLAGGLAGFATLTRTIYAFLPAAAAIHLLADPLRRGRLPTYLAGFAIPVGLWLGLFYGYTGSLPRDTNYLNLAYAIHGRNLSWDTFQTTLAPRFSSYWNVLTINPALSLRALGDSVGTHWIDDIRTLLTIPVGVSAVLGLLLLWRPPIVTATLLPSFLLCYLALCTVFYSPRFGLYLLPFYLSGLALLVTRVIEWAKRRDVAGGTIQASRAWQTGTWIVLALLYVHSGVRGATEVAVLLKDAPFEVRDVGLALRERGPGGSRVMARKPHIAYYSDMDYLPLPRTETLTDLVYAANRLGAQYVFVSGIEAALRPEVAVLRDSGLSIPGLRQVLYRRDRAGGGSAVYAVEPATSTKHDQHVAVSEALMTSSGERKWERQIAIALEQLHSGEFEDALQHLAAAERLRPDDPDIAALQSNCYHALGQYEAAAKACMRSMAIGGATATHLDQLGRIRFMQEEYEEASTSFRRALALEPARSECLYLLGLSEFRLRHYSVAADALGAYMRATPRPGVDVVRLTAISMALAGAEEGAMRLLEDWQRRNGDVSDLAILADSLRSAASR